MFGSWAIGAVIHFSTNGVTTMQRLASSTVMANAQLQRQQGIITRNQLAMIRYNERIAALRANIMRLAATGAMVGATIGFAGITDAVSNAAKLQQILLSIKNETGASNAQIGQFYNAAMAMSNSSGMGVLQSGEILRTISRLTAGQFTIAQMQKVASTIGDYASLIHFNRPDISTETAATTGLQMAHMFRTYDPDKIKKLLDLNYRLSGMMAEGPEAALRQMAYYVPLFKNIGVSDQQSVATMALLDRLGFRNKVGTNVRAQVLKALGPLELTSHAQEGKMALLTQMGLFRGGKFAFNTKDGGLNYFGELQQIGTWYAQQRAKGVSMTTLANTMQGAFGAQGGTIANLFGDPQVLGILKGLSKYLTDPHVGMAAAKQNRDNSLIYQFQRAMNNFQAVMIELGYPWLQDLTRFFRGIADNLHGYQAWLHANKGAEKMIGGVLAGITAILAAFATLATFGILGGAASKIGGIFSWVGRLFTSGGILDTIFAVLWRVGARFIPVVGWVLAIYSALQILGHLPNIAATVTTWWLANRAQIGYTIGYVFGSIGRMIGSAISSLVGMASYALSAAMKSGTSINNLLLLASGPTGQIQYGNAIALAVAQAMRNAPKSATFGQGFGSGFSAGGSGAAYAPGSVHIQGGVTIHAGSDAKGEDIAREFLHVLRNPAAIAARARNSTRIPAPVAGFAGLTLNPG